MNKILITGVTGQLGRLTISYLLQQQAPENIVALVRNKEKAQSLAQLGIELRQGSYDDVNSLHLAFTGIAKVLMISSPELDNVKRLQQQFNAIMAMQQAKVKHIHLVSLADPEKRAFGLEDVDLATEYAIRATGIPFTFLRNGVYFEELQADIRAAQQSGVLCSINKNQVLNYVSRRDLALANANVLSQEGHQNKTYQLVSDHLFNYQDIAENMRILLGKPIQSIEQSAADVLVHLRENNISKDVAEMQVYVFQQAIAQGLFTSSGSDLNRLLGKAQASLPEKIKSVL